MAWIMELLPHPILAAFTVVTLSFVFLPPKLLSQKHQSVNTIARSQNKDER